MSSQSRPTAPRPASTPPTSGAAIGARDSAPPRPTRNTKTTRKMSLQEAWMEAEESIPDLGAATRFLQGRLLIPEGTQAITGGSLVSGMLHLAFTGPSDDLARRGLIAFAYIAATILDRDIQTAVSASVVEHAEDQLVLRLDEHTSNMEERIDEFAGTVKQLKLEMETCSASLRDACERMKEAEGALTEARHGFCAAASTVAPPR